MAELGSWPSIERHGLLSTSALLDLFQVDGEYRTALESQRRASSVRIEHPSVGEAVIRDQKPLSETILSRVLDGVTPAQWYRVLNSRVFFWPTEERLERMLGAAAYRGRDHTVLTIDTAVLLASFHETTQISTINSGATFFMETRPRGPKTFSSFDQFDWAERLRVNRREPVVEVCIDYAVPDVGRFVLQVDTRRVAEN